MKLAGVGRRIMLSALIFGVPACWAFAMAAPAGALPPGCSQVQRTVTCTFNSTGAEQLFTVPAGIGSVQIAAVGAPGGGVVPGDGGTASTTVAVTPGQTLYVEVGGAGTGSAGGFNGGGSPGSSPVRNGEGGGGGASDVRTASGSLSSRLVVAAGGGGSGGAGNDSGANARGGAADSDGSAGRNSADANDKGGGAGLAGTAGGAFGAGGAADSGGTPGSDGTAGGSGVGGTGGGGDGGAGGGGGGGYDGGGGGGGGGESVGHQAGGGGGGGGSCYALGAVACGAAATSTPSVTITYTLPDTTAPTISVVSPGANAVYPIGTTVPASYSCADEAGGSGLATCQGTVASGSPIDTSTPGPHAFTVTARDDAGNTSSRTISYTVVAAPSATISSPAGGARYVVGQVVHTAFACTEASGGPGILTCADSHGTQATPGASQSKSATGVLDTSHAGTHTYTVRAGSADGLSAVAAITYTVVAPPSIIIRAPVANQVYTIGQAVPVRYRCEDGAGGPGIKSCRGSLKKGRLLFTPALGKFKFTVTARSKDGLKTTKTVWYSTTAPTGHAALVLNFGNTVLTDGSVSVAPTSQVGKLLSCTSKGPCSSKSRSHDLTIQVPFSKRAPFKKSQYRALFKGAGASGALYLYVRGPHNTTATFTWSIAGVLIKKVSSGGSGNGVLTEIFSLTYTQLKFQGCSPHALC